MDIVLQIVSIALALLAASLCVVIVAWMAGAIYYDVGRGSRWGAALVVAWVGAVVVGFLVWQPRWQPMMLLLGLFGLFLAWWFSQRPSHDRRWHPMTSQLARASFSGDTVTIDNVRNAEYSADGTATPRYKPRSYRMSQLRGADAVICFWGSRWMCHPMFIFDFGADGRVCMSVEVRYRLRQRYNFWRSLYRQQELIYLVCDERDAILRRTKDAKHHDVYLYRLLMPVDDVREAFYEYVHSINRLVASPRWYHGLTSNCTTTVYAQRRRRARWDWRLLINGGVDRLFYEREQFDQSLPFEMLKAASRVNDVASAAPANGFGDFVRQHLPGYRYAADEAVAEPAADSPVN